MIASESTGGGALRPPLRHIHCLDGLRALAALLVMTFHFLGHHDVPAWLLKLAPLGQTGVDLFFVLSGFLITRILLFSKESPRYFRTFYMRRTLRIFPLYFGFLVIFFFILPLVLGTSIPEFSRQVWAWCYLENLPNTFPKLISSGPSHFWSLAIEEHFYLVWPCVVWLLPLPKFRVAIFVTLAAAIGFRFWLLANGLPVFYFTLTRMDALAFGALLAVLLDERSLSPERWIPLFRWLLLVGPLLLLPSFILFSGAAFNWLQVAKLSLIPLCYFALLGFCVVDPLAGPVVRALSFAPLRWLGGISYGLYVFHPTCFTLVERFLAPKNVVVAAFLCLGFTIVVAYMSFRFFEAPISRLKRHFHYENRH